LIEAHDQLICVPLREVLLKPLDVVASGNMSGQPVGAALVWLSTVMSSTAQPP